MWRFCEGFWYNLAHCNTNKKAGGADNREAFFLQLPAQTHTRSPCHVCCGGAVFLLTCCSASNQITLSQLRSMLLTGSCSANGALLAKHLHRSSSICFALHNARLPSPRLCAKPTATQLRCAGAPRSVVISGEQWCLRRCAGAASWVSAYLARVPGVCCKQNQPGMTLLISHNKTTQPAPCTHSCHTGATSSSSASSASITGSASIPSVLYVTQLDPGIKGDELTAHFRCVGLWMAGQDV